MKHSHYKKDVSNLEVLDIYRFLDLFEVTHPCAQHAIKKITCAGRRGVKDQKQDIQEAIDTLTRMMEMIQEDEQKEAGKPENKDITGRFDPCNIYPSF